MADTKAMTADTQEPVETGIRTTKTASQKILGAAKWIIILACMALALFFERKFADGDWWGADDKEPAVR